MLFRPLCGQQASSTCFRPLCQPCFARLQSSDSTLPQLDTRHRIHASERRPARFLAPGELASYLLSIIIIIIMICPGQRRGRRRYCTVYSYQVLSFLAWILSIDFPYHSQFLKFCVTTLKMCCIEFLY